MQMDLIDPDDIVSLGVPNYSHGIQVQNASRWVQLSGQVGVAPDGTVSPEFEVQCRQAFRNTRRRYAAIHHLTVTGQRHRH